MDEAEPSRTSRSLLESGRKSTNLSLRSRDVDFDLLFFSFLFLLIFFGRVVALFSLHLMIFVGLFSR